MKRFDMRIGFGLILIVAGIMFMLQNLGIFFGGVSLLWAILFGVAGSAFLNVYASNRENWWALIPGTILAAIGLHIAVDAVLPFVGQYLGGAIILAGIALSFWMIYFTRRDFWWAIIPAGILSSVAFVEILDNVFPRVDMGGFVVVGIGLTFLLLGVLPGYENQLRWAFIPGGIMTLIGILTMPIMETIFAVIWPLALIGAGGYVIYKNFKN
ncbi:MAG: hypothetical protein HN736_11410 [Anaerolineae bacterium]|jgi:hypothetical protein|nr:hypothetical protein [Anaerolineae bacterium]MBT3712598.1 hypothetical protein [Anaerolineae bacterium]MBT4309695.1 hypothetical protein [Anaerolineae bacterium]MBT4456888.1 hypothetical protein [Anaerolineae bacterium]MBT4843736.1 hypothetical protein [Anaerolineae bacterium]